MVNSPKRLTISVVIPTYNRAHLVAEAIESVLAQTRTPDEILIVDDGSTDNTAAVLAQFSAPVRVIRQPNRGRSAARNLGVSRATSDIVMFLDSDDLMMPTTLADCADILERRPEVDVVYGDALLVDNQGRRIGLYSDRMPGQRPNGNILGELGRRCCLTMASMVRRSALIGIKFDEQMDFGEDYDFWRQLAARSQFACIDQPVMSYRIHDGMTVSSDPTKTLESELEVQRRIYAMSEFAGLPRRERACAFTAHGAKQAMCNRGQVARGMFWRAIRTDPTYLTSYVLLALGLISLRPLQWAILRRRRSIGNHVAAELGEAALQVQRANPRMNSAPVTLCDRDTVTIESEHEEPVYG